MLGLHGRTQMQLEVQKPRAFFSPNTQGTTPGLSGQGPGTLPVSGRALNSVLTSGKWGSGQGGTPRAPRH